jgi:phenylacetate-CoA ligase
VGAEALPESLRSWFAEHGVPHVLQAYASADIGSIAYETRSGEVRDAGMVLDEDVILEIVRPGSGDPVPAGEVGEVVLTVFNPDYPLIRFATGDLSAILTDAPPSPAAAPTPASRAGWGAPTRPPRCAPCSSIRRRCMTSRAAIRRSSRRGWWCRADGAGGNDFALRSGRSGQRQRRRHRRTIRELTKLRGEVQFVAVGSLPNDGKVIADVRDYQ